MKKNYSTGDVDDCLLRLRYLDQETGIQGWLVVHKLEDGLCAGGIRCREDLEEAELASLARAMTSKQKVMGIKVGGAKSGLAISPNHPDFEGVLQRFITGISPFIRESYACGADINTTMSAIENACQVAGISTPFLAVANNRGIEASEYLRRYQLLSESIDGLTVHQLRAPTATVASAKALVDLLKIESPTVAVQGAGTMGGGIAHLCTQFGWKVVAWADREKTLHNLGGLEVDSLLSRRDGTMLPSAEDAGTSKEVLTVDADILFLAATATALDGLDLESLHCKAIVVAANLALTAKEELRLAELGIVTVPDILASGGGPVSVEATYLSSPKKGADILAWVSRRVEERSKELLIKSRARECSIRQLFDN